MVKVIYQFFTSGSFASQKEAEEYTALLEQNLEDDLKDWFLFPESDKIIDGLKFKIEENSGQIKDLSLQTHAELFDDSTANLRKCIEKNMTETGQQYYQTTDLSGKAAITHGVSNVIYEADEKEADEFARAVSEIPVTGQALE